MGLFCLKKRHAIIEVGWIIDTDDAAFIWPAPTLFERHFAPSKPECLKPAAQRCPAIADRESRLFEIACPFDIHLGFEKDAQNRLFLRNKLDATHSVSPEKLEQLFIITPEGGWRYPDKPLIQISTPYRFLSDEVVYVNQSPAFLHYYDPPLPGVVLTGRIPAHIWPRQLQWAFEWHDLHKDLIIKRGEPWFTVSFETIDPGKHVKLVEVEMTDQLRHYCNGLDSVTNFVIKTFSLFKIATKRRPRKLMKKKQY